jgi:hypothetical protein
MQCSVPSRPQNASGSQRSIVVFKDAVLRNQNDVVWDLVTLLPRVADFGSDLTDGRILIYIKFGNGITAETLHNQFLACWSSAANKAIDKLRKTFFCQCIVVTAHSTQCLLQAFVCRRWSAQQAEG